MEPDRKRQKQLVVEREIERQRRHVEKWREEHEATANLWLVVTYPVEGGEQIRIPTRREFISYYSGLVRGAPDPTDDEFPLIGDFLPSTVIAFARSCLPSPTGLQPYRWHKYCRLVLLSHYLDAPILMNHWLKELQRGRGPECCNDFPLIFALRDKGMNYDMSENSLWRFVTYSYKKFDETEKQIYHKHAHQIFSEYYEVCKKQFEEYGKEADAFLEEGLARVVDEGHPLEEHPLNDYIGNVEDLNGWRHAADAMESLVEALLAMPGPSRGAAVASERA